MVWTCREIVRGKVSKKYTSLVAKDEITKRKMKNIYKKCYGRERPKRERLWKPKTINPWSKKLKRRKFSYFWVKTLLLLD